MFEPLGGAPCVLGRAAKIEEEEDDGNRSERETRGPPRPAPGEKTRQKPAQHHRRPRFQSSTRA